MAHIVYKWESEDTKIYIGDKITKLPQYSITNFSTEIKRSYYVTGNRSKVTFKFIMKRQVAHFIFHLYAPCILVVIISWIAFFIPRDSVAARIALGITSVLTTTTIINMQNKRMPKVAYIKLADWYLIVCFLFVFATLMEYTLILYLVDLRKKRNEDKDKEKLRPSNDINKDFGAERQPVVACDKMHLPETPDGSSRICLSSIDVTVIDGYSRVVFPALFFVYNVYYWINFCGKEASIHFHVI